MPHPRTGSSRKGSVCGYTLDGRECRRRGDHFCEPRADRAVKFITEVCVHTKSVWARKRFRLRPWQSDEIIRPLFGQVRWDAQWGCYVRRYSVAYVTMGRGGGKSELAAAIVLLLLVGDDEESAEVYGAARDTKQAGKVGDVARRMVELSPVLSRRLVYNRQSRRLADAKTNSYYEVIPGDAMGELGHNASGAVIDELLTQASADLWDALRTAQGKRPQSLLMGFTTAGNDPSGFAAQLHAEMVRVSEDPARAPHVFTFIRSTAADADPWDEASWYAANPALGDFLGLETLRQEAAEARNEPAKENAFRQFRLNQWVQQASRWMPLHVWDACAGEVALNPGWVRPRLRGRVAYCGLDLSARFDLTAWCMLVDDGDRVAALWRFWLPESSVAELDKHLSGRVAQWVRDGWLTATEGDVIDYERIYADIEADGAEFKVASVAYDPWSTEPVMQQLRQRLRLRDEQTYPVPQTYAGMTGPMTGLMELVRSQQLMHGGNPVARWHADSVEVRSPADSPELVRPVKPKRGATGKRVDGIAALALAADARARRPARKAFRAAGF